MLKYITILFFFFSINTYAQSINDLYRFIEYDFSLAENNLVNTLKFEKLPNQESTYFFVKGKKSVEVNGNEYEEYEEMVSIVVNQKNQIQNIRYFNTNGQHLINYIKNTENKGFINIKLTDLNYDEYLNDDIFTLFINKENIVMTVNGKKKGVTYLSFYKL